MVISRHKLIRFLNKNLAHVCAELIMRNESSLISYLNKMNLEELRDYCLSLPHVTEDMPFGEDFLVFRICNRIFALTNLERNPVSVNLKCNPERAIELREQYPDKIIAGYHLNKKHWNTVLLEGLPPALIKEMIQHSYDQVLAKVPKKEREMLIS